MKINDILGRLTMIRCLVLGFFFTSVFYFFMYDTGAAQTTAIVAAKTEITKQTKILADTTAKVDHAHEYQRSASEMGEALNKLLAYLPENFRMQDFMKTVSEEAKIASLNIQRVSESSETNPREKKRPDFEELIVTVELGGTFSQIMTFLANLTRQKQIFIVEKFSMDRDTAPALPRVEGESEAPLLIFRGDIHAFRYIGNKKGT